MKVTTGAVVNERSATKKEIIEKWKRKIDKGEYPFIVIKDLETDTNK